MGLDHASPPIDPPRGVGTARQPDRHEGIGVPRKYGASVGASQRARSEAKSGERPIIMADDSGGPFRRLFEGVGNQSTRGATGERDSGYRDRER
jgi:hypothetical protein